MEGPNLEPGNSVEGETPPVDSLQYETVPIEAGPETGVEADTFADRVESAKDPESLFNVIQEHGTVVDSRGRSKEPGEIVQMIRDAWDKGIQLAESGGSKEETARHFLSRFILSGLTRNDGLRDKAVDLIIDDLVRNRRLRREGSEN